MADKTIPALKILRGKVGINTATPDSNHNLTISNTANYGIRLTGTNATIQSNLNLIETAGNNIYLRPGNGYEVWIDNGDGLYVTSGSVGIGTNAPGAKIDVNGSAIFRGAAGWAGNDSQACAIYLNTAGRGVMGNFSNYARNLVKANSNYVEVGQNSTLVYGIKFRVGSNAPNGFMFQSNIGGTMTTHMSIRGDTGRVGIGTNAPGDVLHVDGNTIIGDTDRESVVLTLKAQNTAGAPAATTKLVMKGYEGRGIGTFYEDSSYSGEQWFCGMNYSGGFNSWNVGYDASGDQAEYVANTLLQLHYTGKLQLHAYGSGTHTGTAAYKLAVDSSGNVIETAVGAGQVDGSGTANYVAKWTDGDTIGNSILRDDGTRLAVGAAPSAGGGILHLKDTTSNQAKITLESANAYNSWINFSAASNEMSLGYDKATVGGLVFANSDTIASNIRMVILSGGSVGIGTNNPSCLLQLGTDGVQGGASLAIRRNGDSINFGHVNGAGYGSVIGCSSNNGNPHIGFMCEAGTNINTFRTRGLKGNVIFTNTSGTLNFGQVTNANADNQSVTTRVAIESDGDAYFYGGNWFCNTNNSTNVSNGGLYINRGGGLYAYALATARSGTALNGVDFWDYHGVGLVFGPDSSTKVLTVKSNIGIGTTDPGYILDVRTASLGAMQVKGSGNGLLIGEAAYSQSANYTGLKTVSMTNAEDYMIISGTSGDGNTYVSAKSGNNLHLRAGGNNSGNEMVVSTSTGITYKSGVRHEFSTGNVGISTSTVNVKLAVAGQASFADRKLSLIGLDINSRRHTVLY